MTKKNRKMFKIKERNYRYVEAVMERRNCSTLIDAFDLICQEHKKHSKDPMVRAQDKIIDAEHEVNDDDQRKFLAHVRRVLGLVNSGHDEVLDTVSDDLADFIEGLEMLDRVDEKKSRK